LIAAVVLAAGLSTRMGKPKQTLPLKGRPMLEQVLLTYRRAKVDRVVVVLGAEAADVRKNVRFQREKVVINPGYKGGMSSSLRLGLGEVEREAEAVIIALGDQPFVSAETINLLVDAHRASKAPVVVPVYHGARGNPVLFDRTVFSQIKEVRGDVGAKSVVARNRDRVLQVDVEDGGVLWDIDTPSDYARAESWVAATRERRSRAGA
jgi:molybdenum cofactor cytidylyltransferase